MNKTSNYIYYGCPGVVILIISVLTSLRIGIDFGNDPMVRVGVFCACSILLWMLYEAVFLPAAAGLCNLIEIAVKGRKTIVVHESVAIKQPATETITYEEPSTEEVSDLSIPSNKPSYEQRVAEYQQAQENKKARLLSLIDEYIHYIMPPFLSDKDMPHVIEEVHHWANNPKYEPTECIHPKIGVTLSTNVLKHFVWNIGERLGQANGYDGESRCKFIRGLFKTSLRDVEDNSLKNFRTTAYSDKIELDVPIDGNFEFHYDDNQEKQVV